MPTVRLEPVPSIETAPYRMYWQDIAGRAYPPAFLRGFRYHDAEVLLTYEASCPGRLAGSLVAHGLKPHFCYQLKLSGKPAALHGSAGDDETNERIGRLGRWWRERPDPGNADDGERESQRGNPEYVYSGYLIFGFLVTDREGAAAVPFVTDSSYHVVWKRSQRARGRYDGPLQWHTIDGDRVGLFAEWEPSRPRPGKLQLPAGCYQLEFRLVEESFHDEKAFWAQVMRAEVQFVVEKLCRR